MGVLKASTHDTDPGPCLCREPVGGPGYQEGPDLALPSRLLLLDDGMAQVDARRADKDTVGALYERSNFAVVLSTKGAESVPLLLLLVVVRKPSHRPPRCRRSAEGL